MIESGSIRDLSSIQTQDKKTLVHSDTCVILHLYYPEMWSEIRSYLANLGGDFDLFVTIPYDVNIAQDIIKAHFPDAQIYRCENRGRDIAPFLTIFSAISKLGYKYICKIHTKKSVHIATGKEWRRDMMDKLLGSPETVARIKRAFDEHPDWGLIAPHGHVVPHTYYWTRNAEKVLGLAASMSIPTDNIGFSYVAGSMFWFRPQALQLLLNDDVLMHNFEPEQGQQDATLAHAFERLFGMVSNFAGYKIAASDSNEIKLVDSFFHFGLLVQEFDKQVQAVHALTAQTLKQKESIESLSRERLKKEQAIAQKEQAIVQKDQQLTRNNQLIQSLTQQLAAIRSSTAWSIALRITRVASILFPLGTRRGRIARLAIQAIRIWRNEGLKVVLQKTFSRIKIFFSRLFFRSQPKIIESTVVTSNPYVPISELDVDPANVLVKVIAFYLPQFHPIPENDVWWGKGFTEWTNVSKAFPNFMGHYQPHLPGELGFYDLRVPEVQRRQVELAKKYGIYGFCFYYYWFAGKRLLERPLDQFLANPDLDFPFCLCWANENWTRRWDGAEHEVLIGQTHNEQEYLQFIQDISPHFRDPRYIHVDGKPILLVYRVNLLPDPQKAARIWRDECKRLGIGDLYLIAAQSFGITDPRPYGFDAAVEFPPHNLNIAAIDQNALSITNPQFIGRVFDYEQAAQDMLNRRVPEYTLFKTVMPSWDNTARKQDAGYAFVNSSPANYKDWLAQAVRYTKANLPVDKQFIFVNAWNEWAEGTHLEPDRLYGYAYLQATADVVSTPRGWSILFVSHDAFPSGSQRALLSTIAWLKEHTTLSLKILCLDGGELLPRFKALADTVLLSDLQDGESEFVKENVIKNLLKFCGGTPGLIYGNSVVSGKAYSWLHELSAPILTHVYELEMSIQRYAANWMGDVLNHSTHFIAPSNAVKDNLIKNHAVDSNIISIVHGAVPDESVHLYHSAQEKDQARKTLGLDTGKVLIVGCGWGMPYRKGADLFIELGNRLRRLGRTDFHSYWIGEFEDSESDFTHETWADHKAKLTKNNLGDFVTFLGYKENFKEYFKAADIFVLPSREDPLPLVAIEAAKYGLPLVCFAEAGGTPDLVGDDAGFVVPLEDVEIMANKILRLMDDSDLRVAMGKRARERFLSQFSVEKTTPALLSICRQVARQNPVVSVIVPNYNCEKYLEKRLNSILDQTFKDFELILIDDASTDQSVNILERYLDHPNVRLFRNNTNSGNPFRQWYKGFSEAKGDILWFAEADDFCEPDFLQKLLPSFHNSSIALAYCDSFIVNEAGEVVGNYESYLNDLDAHHWKTSYQVTGLQEINFGLGVKNSIPNASAVLLRKSCVSEAIFQETFHFNFSGDWFFYTQMLKGKDIAFCSERLNYHRKHGQTVSSRFNTDSSAIPLLLEEAALIHNNVIEHYSLYADYLRKWQFYVAKQIRAFHPNAAEEEFDRHYPYTEMEEKIEKAILRSQTLKRLAFLTTNDVAPNGGSEQLWIETALECRKRGYEVTVVIKQWDPVPPFFQRFQDAGIRIIFKGQGDFHQIMLFDPDLLVVSIGDQDEGIGWYEKCRAHDIPYIIINQLTKEPQYSPIRREINERVKSGYLNAAKVFFTCKNNQAVMEKRLNCQIPNAGIHYNPFHVDKNSFVPFPSMDNGLRLAIPANLVRVHKGQHLAIELFSHKKWRDRPIRLNLYGTGSDEEILRSMVNKYGLKKVFFHGHIADLLTIWRDNHAIFLPSFMEGLPLVLVGAMLCARVPILTDVGAHREVVDDNINGFIAAKPTVEALDEALERAYQKATLWQEIGQRARERILAYLPSHDPVDDFIAKIIPLANKRITYELSGAGR